MKNSLIIGLLCIGIGFGAAWIVKPRKEPALAENSEPKKSSPTGGSNRLGTEIDEVAKSNRPEADPGIAINGEEVGPKEKNVRAEFTRGRDRFREMLTKRQSAKEEAMIKKLVDRLGLTDDQAEKLRAHLSKNREKRNALMSENGDLRNIRDFTKTMNNDNLDEALAEILTDEQKLAYEEMKERERTNQVEARAYKDLAAVQGVLDLNPDQKDQVYELLHDQAAKKLDANKDANAIVATMTEGFGININPDDLGAGISGAIQGVINQAADGEQPSEDRGEMLRNIRENRQREIDEKVELLAPVLDDGQEETYRNHLESQGGGILGNLFQGAINIESFEIPGPTPAPQPAPAPAPASGTGNE